MNASVNSHNSASNLSGRVAVITGGGGRLGSAMARAMSHAGAAVALVGRTEAKLMTVRDEILAAGGNAIAVPADITSRPSLETMATRVVNELGGIDILVNNAGIFPKKPWREITEPEWDDVLATNVRGYFTATQVVHPYLAASGHGRIINISSIAFFGAWAELISYVASKGGVVALSRALARQLGPDAITVNTLSVGAYVNEREQAYADPAAYEARMIEHQSIKRRITAADVGDVSVFLASDASSAVTGQQLEVDGGWVML